MSFESSNCLNFFFRLRSNFIISHSELVNKTKRLQSATSRKLINYKLHMQLNVIKNVTKTFIFLFFKILQQDWLSVFPELIMKILCILCFNIHSYHVNAWLISSNPRAFGGDSWHCANRLMLKRQMFPIKIPMGRWLHIEVYAFKHRQAI